MSFNKLISFYILSLCFFVSPNFFVLLFGQYGYVLIFCLSFFLLFNFIPKLLKTNNIIFYTLLSLYIVIFTVDFFTNTPLDYYIFNFFNFILLSYLVLGLFPISLDKLFFYAIISNFILLILSIFSSNLFNIIFQGGVEQALNENFFRFQGTFGTPGYASLFLTASFIHSFFCINKPNSKLYHFITLLGALIFGILTGNRSFLVFSTFSFFLFILFNFKNIILKLFYSFSIFKITIILIIFIFIFIKFDMSFLFSYFQGRFENGFENRLHGENGFIDIILNMDIKSFFVGSKFITESGDSYIRLNDFLYQPHNALIVYFSSYGILGLLLSIVLLILLIYRGRLNDFYEKNYFILIIVMLLFSLGEPFLFTPIQVLIYINNKSKLIKY